MTIEDDPRTGSSASRPLHQSTARDIERYAGLFAARTRVMKSSAMRDLMAVTARPEVISLAGGLPDTSTFPPEMFAAVAQRIANESCAKALQYGPTDGLVETKACIAEVMLAEGMRVDAEDIIVTTGGQQVIDLVTKTLVDPGDVIVAEAPTYPGAVPTFSSYQAHVVQVEMDRDGMRVDLLEEALDQLERDGRRPKFIYTVPTFQNPAGVTMSLERRTRLVEIARRRELLVLEDNPYGLLRYEGEGLPPLRVLDGGVYVMYLGTFSKILSPGIRMGWVVAPPPVLEKINLGKQAADLCTSTLSQLMVQAYFEESRWRDYVESLTEVYRDRRDTMLDALAEFFPREAEWTRPQGGMFIWVTLPDFIDTTDLLARALRQNVAFVPGAAAYLDGRGHNSMRLNFSATGGDDIREGIRRIGEVVKEQVALYGTLTGERKRSAPAAPRTEDSPKPAEAVDESGARVVPMRRRKAG
jgi:2-aminoadipate transaminase